MFESHTVADNILLALKGPRAGVVSLFGWRNRVQAERIDALLETVGLLAHRERPAADLSHGQKQWLEIGMLLAQDPKLLLVDEPVAGMTDAETEATATLLRTIAEDHAVVVVEHDMAFVRALACRVTCLHEGAVLAEGSIDAVSADPRVGRGVSRAMTRGTDRMAVGSPTDPLPPSAGEGWPMRPQGSGEGSDASGSRAPVALPCTVARPLSRPAPRATLPRQRGEGRRVQDQTAC